MVMNDREPAEEMVTYEEFTTPSGQRAMVKLHDGTTVWLNARSTPAIRIILPVKNVKWNWTGEAFFDVEHNEHKPFVVSTEKLDIKSPGNEV